jgi:AraC-like DNA-binding protein
LSYIDVSVTEVAFPVGFVASRHFARVFKRAYGIRPSALPQRQPA